MAKAYEEQATAALGDKTLDPWYKRMLLKRLNEEFVENVPETGKLAPVPVTDPTSKPYNSTFLAGLSGFAGNKDENKQTPFMPYLSPKQDNQKPNDDSMPFFNNPLDMEQPGLAKHGEIPKRDNLIDWFLDGLRDPRGRNKYAPLPGAIGGNAGASEFEPGFGIPGNVWQPDWQKEQKEARSSQLEYSGNQPDPANAGSFQGEQHDTTAEVAEQQLRKHISEGRYDLVRSILGHSRGREALEAIGVDVGGIAEEAEEEKRKQEQRDARFRQGLFGKQEGQELPVTEQMTAGPETGPMPQTTTVIPAQPEKTIDISSTTSQTPDKEEEPDTPMMHYFKSRGYDRKYTYSQMNEIMEEFWRSQPKVDNFSPSRIVPTDEEFYAIGEELFGKPSYTPPTDILNMSVDDYLDALENDDTKTTTAYIDAIRKGLIHQPYFSDTQRRRFTALMYDKAPPGGVELLAGLAGVANGSTLNLMDLFRSIGRGTNSETDKQFWELIDELKRRKPGAYSTGEVLGQMIPMLVTGGLLKNPLGFIKNPYLNNAILWGASAGIPTLLADINKGKPAEEVIADTLINFGTGAAGGIVFRGLADILPQAGTLEFQKLLDSGVSERLVYALGRLAKPLNPKVTEAAGKAKGKYAESDFVEELLGKNSKGKTAVEVPFDTNGKLMPDVKYKSGEFGYSYTTDSMGRLEHFKTDRLQLTTRTERLPHNPDTPGKLPGDHAGHLAGDRFGGSPEIDNLVSQLSDINLSQYRRIENQWATALREGKRVQVNVGIVYNGNDMRPSGFNINYTIDGKYYSRTLIN